MDDELRSGFDDEVERIAVALRPLPEVDPAARARVLVAVAAERAAQAESRARPRWRRWALAGALAASAALVVVMVRGRKADQVSSGPVAAERSEVSRPVTNASAVASGGDASLVPVQLVASLPQASHVAVVGDFTGWDAERVAMVRDPASGLWSATVHVRPGRHVYAFVVDDSVLVRDPRAPAVRDDDFGRPGSLLLVGRQ